MPFLSSTVKILFPLFSQNHHDHVGYFGFRGPVAAWKCAQPPLRGVESIEPPQPFARRLPLGPVRQVRLHLLLRRATQRLRNQAGFGQTEGRAGQRTHEEQAVGEGALL